MFSSALFKKRTALFKIVYNLQKNILKCQFIKLLDFTSVAHGVSTLLKIFIDMTQFLKTLDFIMGNMDSTFEGNITRYRKF